MAKFDQIGSADENGSAVFICRATNFIESLKLAWYVLRYPEKVSVVMAIRKEWRDANLADTSNSRLEPPAD